MAEYAVVSFCLVAIASSAASRLIRYRVRKDSELNQIIPLSENVNKITITRQNGKVWVVRNNQGRKIYELSKADSTWHLQAINGQTLSTIKYGLREKYIVMSRSSYLYNLRDSPLETTPSVIRLDPDSWNFSFHGYNKSIFQFGSNVKLQWIGLEHFEILTKNPNSKRDGDLVFHERVASLKSYDKSTGYSILFDYDKINLEILISTFMISLLSRTYGYP